MNAPCPILVTPVPIVTALSAEQSKKALPPISVTLSGMVIPVRFVQRANADCPILVTLLPIVTALSAEQSEKALPPISVTVSGIVTLVSFEQSTKAPAPILVTVFGIARLPTSASLSVTPVSLPVESICSSETSAAFSLNVTLTVVCAVTVNLALFLSALSCVAPVHAATSYPVSGIAVKVSTVSFATMPSAGSAESACTLPCSPLLSAIWKPFGVSVA